MSFCGVFLLVNRTFTNKYDRENELRLVIKVLWDSQIFTVALYLLYFLFSHRSKVHLKGLTAY